MATDILPVEDLPRLGRELARAADLAHPALISSSLDRLLDGAAAFRDAPVLRRIHLDWRFRITRQHERVVFFFFKRKGPTEVVARLEVELEMDRRRGTEGDEPGTVHRFHPPAGLVLRPSSAELERHGPVAPEVSPSNTLLVRAGSNEERVVAVAHPERLRRGALGRYTAPGYDLPFTGQERTWPLGPVLALLDAMRLWTGKTQTRGGAVAFVPDEATDAGRVLAALGRLIRATARAGQETSAKAKATQRWLPSCAVPMPALSPSDLKATVLLRLNDEGRLATRHDEDPFEVGLEVELDHSPVGPVLHSLPTLPDFLVAGDLRDLLVQALRDSHLQPLHAALRVGPHGQAYRDDGVTPEGLDGFLDRTAGSATVFRIRRKHRSGAERVDTDVLAFRGLLGAGERVLIIQARFRLDPEPGGGRRVRARAVKDVLYYGPPEPTARALKPRAIRHFLRVLAALHRWLGVFR